jgi:hypothetical protein
VKVFRELWDSAVSIEEDCMVMIALGDGQDDLDLEPLRCLGETVREHLVGEPVGAQEELALRAPPRE